MTTLQPITPGELLLKEFMEPLGLTTRALSGLVGIPEQTVVGILDGTVEITPGQDFLLCNLFGLAGGYWLRVQTRYNLDLKLAGALDRNKAHFALAQAYLDAIKSIEPSAEWSSVLNAVITALEPLVTKNRTPEDHV